MNFSIGVNLQIGHYETASRMTGGYELTAKLKGHEFGAKDMLTGLKTGISSKDTAVQSELVNSENIDSELLDSNSVATSLDSSSTKMNLGLDNSSDDDWYNSKKKKEDEKEQSKKKAISTQASKTQLQKSLQSKEEKNHLMRLMSII